MKHSKIQSLSLQPSFVTSGNSVTFRNTSKPTSPIRCESNWFSCARQIEKTLVMPKTEKRDCGVFMDSAATGLMLNYRGRPALTPPDALQTSQGITVDLKDRRKWPNPSGHMDDKERGLDLVAQFKKHLQVKQVCKLGASTTLVLVGFSEWRDISKLNEVY